MVLECSLIQTTPFGDSDAFRLPRGILVSSLDDDNSFAAACGRYSLNFRQSTNEGLALRDIDVCVTRFAETLIWRRG